MKQKGGCLPDSQQKALIQTLLAAPETRPALWQEWKNQSNLEKLDSGSLRLLPLLYFRLKEAEFTEAELTRYHGIYRHYWYRNRLYLKALGSVLTALNQLAITPLLLKGLPLALETYPDPALRPMMDMDLYIPPKRLPEAVHCLSETGWVPDRLPPEKPDERWLAAVKAVELAHSDGLTLDLHGTILSEIADSSFDALILANARPFTLLNGNALLPHPTGLLFHTIAHGYRWNSSPPFRWIVDTAELLHRHRDELNVAQLVQTAEQFNLTKRIQKGMELVNSYLNNEFRELTYAFAKSGYSMPLWEQMEHWLITRNHVLPARTGYLVFDTWRWIRRHPWRVRISECLQFLKLRWNITHSRQLPVELFQRIRRRITGKPKATTR
ncbi:MAG: nucleotidyltransferase family protein [Acidobacteria bacterium]|nr:nucleotidyltransferase family protein [Acidobacteriota bacterium]